MRKILFLLFPVLIATNTNLEAQSLKKVTELKMPKTEDDDMPGTRGASVAWNPQQKKYYAAFAGNSAYPLAVFDAKGARLSDDELTTMIDIRGLWYNPATMQISGNSYKTYGWFNYTLDKKGIPENMAVTTEGMNQPTENSVGVYSNTTKQTLFLNQGQVYFYNRSAQLTDSIVIHWGRKKADGPADDEDATEIPEDYNYTSLVYTGIKGQELGFLNTTENEIELYDIKTGFLTKTLALPETAVVESSFNFAYANNIYWLFNIEERKWVGYK